MNTLLACAMLLTAGVVLRAQTGSATTIAGIVSSADNSAAELGIAPGSLFTIYGVNLTTRSATAAAPLTELAGASVRVRTSSFDARAPMLYASPSQINALMPAEVAPGEAEVWLEKSSGNSAVHVVPIVRSRFTAFTRTGASFGPAIVQQYRAGDVTLNRLLEPALPTDAVVIWGTGLGGARRDDVRVFFGDAEAKPFYAGPAPTVPGVDQINVFLPSGVTLDCFVPFVVDTGASRAVYTLSTAGAPGNCRTASLPLDADALARLDGGAALRLTEMWIQETAAQAWTGEYDAAHLARLFTYDSQPASGEIQCVSTGYTFDRYSGPRSLPPDPVEFAGNRKAPDLLEAAVTGPGGCGWTFLQSGDGFHRATAPAGCPARAFSFRSAANTLSTNLAPFDRTQPRAPQLMFDRASGKITWTNNVTGRLTLVLSSSFTLHGSIFNEKTDVREVTCRLPGTSGTARVRPDDLAFAFGLPQAEPVRAYQWLGSWMAERGSGSLEVLAVRVFTAFPVPVVNAAASATP